MPSPELQGLVLPSRKTSFGPKTSKIELQGLKSSKVQTFGKPEPPLVAAAGFLTSAIRGGR